MNRKTILNVLIAILLCVSTFASMATAAGEVEMVEDMHTVDIMVDHEGDDENNMTVTVTFEWDYPSQMRNMASEGDDVVSAGEAIEFATALESSSLEEIQEAHRSHVWDMSIGGVQGTADGDSEVPWVISTSVTGLEGTQDDNNSFTVSVQLSMDMSSTQMTSQNLSMTFGPIDDKDGMNVSVPQWPTGITVNNGQSWCASDIIKDDDSSVLDSEFAYHPEDEFSFTATYSQECEDVVRADGDKDGVPDTIDDCPGSADGVVVDETGCEPDAGCVDGTDDDDDSVDNCADTCPGTIAGDDVNQDGCSAAQLEDDVDDWTFNITFNVAAAPFKCTGMTNDSSALDCMNAAGATLSAVSDVPAGHPHAWSWELQVNAVAAADQDPANMMLNSQSTFDWVSQCTSGSADCSDKVVTTVTNLSGSLDIASGECVFFDGVTPVFGDVWDDLGEVSRCFSAEGTYTSGDFTINVGSSADTDTTIDPIDDSTIVVDAESTPGFGLVVGITAALGAALIAASRRED